MWFMIVYIFLKSIDKVHDNFIMLSEAGRQYERSRRVKPLERIQREKVYKSQSVKA